MRLSIREIAETVRSPSHAVSQVRSPKGVPTSFGAGNPVQRDRLVRDRLRAEVVDRILRKRIEIQARWREGTSQREFALQLDRKQVLDRFEDLQGILAWFLPKAGVGSRGVLRKSQILSVNPRRRSETISIFLLSMCLFSNAVSALNLEGS